MTIPITGSVHIIGAGLLGSSIGLGLRAKNVPVTISDISTTAQALAIDYGAGSALQQSSQPELVIVATPPDQTAQTVAAALKRFPDAIVTDVASVKAELLQQLRQSGADLSRYVGSHPMAGREKGGTIMARADLFVGRPWVICGHSATSTAALNLVTAVALALAAVPTVWQPEAHDEAVAAVSHLPQVVASLLAAQLLTVQENYLELAGAGLRDTTRIAASDPALWLQILSANHATVAVLLEQLGADMAEFAAALRDPSQPGSRTKISQLLAAGNAGLARVPGKHGSMRKYATLQVIIVDERGQLAQLFTDLDELEINMEDFRLEHSPGAAIGFAEISVLPEAEKRAVAELTARGWRIL